MTRSLQWLVAFCLLALSLGSLAQSQEPPSLDRALQTIETALNSDGSTLLPTEPVLEIYSLHRLGEKPVLEIDEASVERLETLFRSLSRLVQEHRRRAKEERQLLTENLCFFHWPSHNEMPRELPSAKLSISEVLAISHTAIIGRVQSSRGGFFGTFPTTLKEFSVTEILKDQQRFFQVGDIASFGGYSWSMTVDGERICSERPGFLDPEPGQDLLLLFLHPLRSLDHTRIVAPSLILPIIEETVTGQPYNILREGASLSISEVREAAALAGLLEKVGEPQ